MWAYGAYLRDRKFAITVCGSAVTHSCVCVCVCVCVCECVTRSSVWQQTCSFHHWHYAHAHAHAHAHTRARTHTRAHTHTWCGRTVLWLMDMCLIRMSLIHIFDRWRAYCTRLQWCELSCLYVWQKNTFLLQCVAVCCNVSHRHDVQCVSVYLQYIAVCCKMMRRHPMRTCLNSSSTRRPHRSVTGSVPRLVKFLQCQFVTKCDIFDDYKVDYCEILLRSSTGSALQLLCTCIHTYILYIPIYLYLHVCTYTHLYIWIYLISS